VEVSFMCRICDLQEIQEEHELKYMVELIEVYGLTHEEATKLRDEQT
jgi:hypothetical protein